MTEFERLLGATKLKKKDVAQRLGLHPVTVYKWREAPAYCLAYLRLYRRVQALKEGADDGDKV